MPDLFVLIKKLSNVAATDHLNAFNANAAFNASCLEIISHSKHLYTFGDWPIWLNDDRHLLFVSQGKIFSIDLKTRKYQPVLTVTEQDVDIGSPGVSPDNRVIYFTFVATEADIWVMNLNESPSNNARVGVLFGHHGL